jgi:hypothetical protein
MTDELTIRQGDTSRPVRARAFDADGFIDLTVFTGGIVFRMTGAATVQGAATGDADGNLSYTFAAGETDTVGEYEAVFVATDGSGKVQTFPQATNLRVTIVAAI